MKLSIFKSKASDNIDIQTAYNIWSQLVIQYESLESMQVLGNFVHDSDLQAALRVLSQTYEHQVTVLEKEIKRYKLKTLTRPPKSKTSAQVQVITDRFVFTATLNDQLCQLFSLGRAIRSTLTSDRIREMFRGFLLEHSAQFTRFFKYGKIKAWENVTPAYKTPGTKQNEPLSLNGVYHIWNHLRMRYQQLELTLFYENMVHDQDFRAGLVMAGRTLEGQIKTLENLAEKFEIPMPQCNPASMEVPVDPESVEDRFIYQQIFLGVDAMVELHTRALVEIQRNSNVRKVFLKLLKEELTAFDRMVKYGKLKEWLELPPVYSPG